MKTTVFNSLGLKVSIKVPETYEEFAAAADGNTQACLNEAVAHIVAHGTLGEFREEFCELAEKRFEFPRKTKATGKFTVENEGQPNEIKTPITEWDESEKNFINRLCVEKGWVSDEIISQHLQPLADEVAGLLKFDAAATERKAAKPKTLPKIYSEAAGNIIKNGNLAAWVKKLKKEDKIELVVVLAEGDVTEEAAKAKNIESLGWAIKEREDRKRAAAVQEYA